MPEPPFLDSLYRFFGHGENLNVFQVCMRSLVVFLFALILIRLRGLRMFSMKTPFDSIVAIMMGAILSRAILGLRALTG